MLNKLIITVGVFFSFVFNASAAGEAYLSLGDIQPTMKEMFSYHVEHKDFSSILVRRSCRVFIEQFDVNRSYLLKSEVEPFLALDTETVLQVIRGYRSGNFSFYEKLNRCICRAIDRNQRLRKRVMKKLGNQAAHILTLSVELNENDYMRTEADLEQLIYDHFLYQTQSTLRRREIKEPTSDVIRKILNHIEARQVQAEASYLEKSEPKAGYFLALHLLKALAKSLDAHSGYYSPAEAQRIRVALQKQFSGVGIVLQEDFDAIYISELVTGGPADKSGRISAGDQLVAINHQSIKDLSFKQVLERLTGENGSPLVLGIKKVDEKEGRVNHVKLMRERIVMNDQRLLVTSEPFGGGIIGKISLPAFYDNGGQVSAERDLRAALRQLQKQGNLLGLVIDLRENAGGFLKQAIKVSDLFIQSGVIVVSKYARNQVNYAANLSRQKSYDGPLVLLTSKASASAAEIVAQALQDYGVALVVGDERSYGKGSMQHQTITDPRSKVFFKVTVGRYYTASGRSPQIQGVGADLVIPTRYFPYRIGERYLAFPLSNDHLSRDIFQALKNARRRSEGSLAQLVVPYLRPRTSQWRKMLPQLIANSKQRLDSDSDFQLFLKVGKLRQANSKDLLLSPRVNAGVDDLQLKEAVMVVKDMILIQQAQVSAF